MNSYHDLWKLICRTNLPVARLVVAALFGIFGSAAYLAYPIIVQQLIDLLAVGADTAYYIISLFSLLIFGAVTSIFSDLILTRIQHSASGALRVDLTKKMLRLPVFILEQSHTGNKISRVISDCQSISSLVTKHFVNFLISVLMFVGSVVVLFFLDLYLTLVLFSTLVVAFLVAGLAVMKMESISVDMQEHTAKFSGLLMHVFSEIRLVKAFSAEEREQERAHKKINELKDTGYRLDKLKVILDTIFSLSVVSALIVILVYGGMRIGQGDLTVGVLTAFILYIFNVTGPMALIGAFFSELQIAKGASLRISQIFKDADEAEMHYSPGNIVPKRVAALEFQDLSFYYPGGEGKIIDNLSFKVAAGKTVALVGASGSGKSTIISLIERFYEPVSGSILYDDKSIIEFDNTAWRKSIGFVPQSSPIMPGTVRDNITYGLDGDFSEQDIREASRKACALGFIENLPNGFDTELLEQGSNISGGQRQRIAIARVFLRDPYMILLDEATSSLDSETENQVKSALDNLMKGRTSLVIAHNLTTVLQADKVAFLVDGALSGYDDHEALYSYNSDYSRLIDSYYSRFD